MSEAFESVNRCIKIRSYHLRMVFEGEEGVETAKVPQSWTLWISIGRTPLAQAARVRPRRSLLEEQKLNEAQAQGTGHT